MTSMHKIRMVKLLSILSLKSIFMSLKGREERRGEKRRGEGKGERRGEGR